MKLYFIFPLLLYLCSCGSGLGSEGFPTLEGDERNKCYFKLDRGYVIKWKNLPIPIYIHNSTSALVEKNMAYAVDIWNQSWHYHTGKGAIFELMGTANQEAPDKSGDGINMLLIDNDMNLLTIKQQGTTMMRNKFGGTIFDADIIINNIDHDYFYENESFDYIAHTPLSKLNHSRSLASSVSDSLWNRFLNLLKPLLSKLFFWKKTEERSPDRERQIQSYEIDFISLAVHELGHVTGLVHIEPYKLDNNIMNPKLRRGIFRRDISDTELDYISCNYFQTDINE